MLNKLLSPLHQANNTNLSIPLRSNIHLRNPSPPLDTSSHNKISPGNLELAHPLAHSMATKVLHHIPHLEDFPVDHQASRLRPVFHSDLHLVHLSSPPTRCSRCTKALLHKVVGEAMDGKVKIRTQLCHQLILLTLKATMGIIRLTLLRWMTLSQAPQGNQIASM